MLNYSALIEQYGSPLYKYDLDEIEEAHEKLSESLPRDSIVYYSLKANPHPEIVRYLLKKGVLWRFVLEMS